MWSRITAAWDAYKANYLKRHPRAFGEQHLDDDVHAVIEAASDLDISEFQVFTNAYERWFGHSADEQQVERYYLGYMFRGKVPHWVREYARQVASSSARHRLDPVEFGIELVTRRRVKVGVAMFAIAFASIAILVTVAEYTSTRQLQSVLTTDVKVSYRP